VTRNVMRELMLNSITCENADNEAKRHIYDMLFTCYTGFVYCHIPDFTFTYH